MPYNYIIIDFTQKGYFILTGPKCLADAADTVSKSVSRINAATSNKPLTILQIRQYVAGNYKIFPHKGETLNTSLIPKKYHKYLEIQIPNICIF